MASIITNDRFDVCACRSPQSARLVGSTPSRLPGPLIKAMDLTGDD